MDEELEILIRSFGRCITNSKWRVHYVLPRGEASSWDGQMAFYIPYNGEAKATRQGLKSWVIKLCQEGECGVFSCAIEMPFEGNRRPVEYYITAESGWHEVVFDLQRLIEAHHQLAHRRLALFGESSGGSMAQRMVAAHPERIAAAAWCGGSRYVEWPQTLPTESIPMLALNVWGCPGLEATRQMASAGERAGWKVLRGVLAPGGEPGKLNHHAASTEAQALMRAFLVEALHPGDGDFQRLWEAVPHADIARAMQMRPGELTEGFAVAGNPPAMAFLFLDSSASCSIQPLDALEFCRRRGLQAYCAVVDAGFRQELTKLEAALAERLAKCEGAVWLLGDGQGAEVALAMSKTVPNTRLRAVAGLNPPLSWNDEELAGKPPVWKGYEWTGSRPAQTPSGMKAIVAENAEAAWRAFLEDVLPEAQ